MKLNTFFRSTSLLVITCRWITFFRSTSLLVITCRWITFFRSTSLLVITCRWISHLIPDKVLVEWPRARSASVPRDDWSSRNRPMHLKSPWRTANGNVTSSRFPQSNLCRILVQCWCPNNGSTLLKLHDNGCCCACWIYEKLGKHFFLGTFYKSQVILKIER